ncbi:MAG TPA: alanine racemase [Pseudogracilibacillus sp.]|nr:alanine racemase [Pseudogracilibacillus sp.]
MVRYRNTWAEIDLAAIRHNVEQLQTLLPHKKQIMGVIKANAYGHGSVEVAKTLVKSGIDHLVVAYLEEAIALRESGIDVPILVIGRIEPRLVKVANEYNVTLSIFQAEWIEAALEESFSGTLSIHLEFETGFNRTGIYSEETLREILALVEQSAGKINITGAFTHFATADEIDSLHYERQKKRYETMLRILEDEYDGAIIAHIGNSAAGIQYPEQMKQYTRVGISLYGLYPSAQIEAMNKINLQQAFSLYSELIEVKQIKTGESIGYGQTYKAKESEWIGTIPIGYADGWPRLLQGFYVLIGGRKHQIVGRVCMDMIMVKLDRPYEVGEKVTLIGSNGAEFISMDDVANYLKTINYEIPCMITSRVAREYING